MQALKEHPLSVMTFTFPGQPVPYVRVTRNSLWTKEAKNYSGYKDSFRDAIVLAHPKWIVPNGPCPKTEKAARTKWIKEQQKYEYEVWITAYIPSLWRGDTDNFAKTVLDSLKHAKFFYDDTLVVRVHAEKKQDAENPRMVVTMEKILR